MEACQQKLMTVDSENDGLQPAVEELHNNMNESTQKTENLPNVNIISGKSIMLRSELNNSVTENMNVDNEIKCAVNNNFVELVKQSEEEAKCEVKVTSESNEISHSLNEKEVLLTQHGMDVSEKNKIIDEGQSLKTNIEVDGYRCESESWSDDDDSSSTSDTSSDSDFFQMIVESSGPKKIPDVKTKGELGLDDLPPIEDLVITVHEEEMMLIGKIHAVVDKLVVIHALRNMKALDLDSVLFLSHDKPLGRVFDVFGPVVEPFYCVRFNSVDHINEKGIEIGADVFFAPEKSDITSYVFVDELQRQKGSDASWKFNNEPPEECLDFSDDEKEKAAKRKRMTKHRNRQLPNNPVATKRPSLAGDSSSHSNYRPVACPPSPRSDVQILSAPFSRRNPFSTPLPPVSPSPSFCNVMSAPVHVQNSYNFSPVNRPHLPFSHSQGSYPSQHVLQRSTSPLLVASYQQPHVFGQVTVLSTISPLQSPSLFHTNMPTLIPPSVTPENYFHPRFTSPPPNSHNFSTVNPQRFPRPSSAYHSQHASSDPWLRNESPGSVHLPPNHPLTVQIPNLNSPPLSVNPFQPGNDPMQPLVNNMNLYNRNRQSRFY